MAEEIFARSTCRSTPHPSRHRRRPGRRHRRLLLVAHEHASRDAEDLTPDERAHLRDGFVRGFELVDGAARLAAMNLLLHGIGSPNGDSLIGVRDSLIADPGTRWSVALSNPPFGRKSSITMVGADGRHARTARSSGPTSWSPPPTSSSTSCSTSPRSSTSTAAPPSSCPTTCSSRAVSGKPCGGGCSPSSTCITLLRLPTGVFYAQGVKANALFFDKRPARAGQPWTERLWVYDLRTNRHFTLKQNPLRSEHLQDFVDCYAPGKPRGDRAETERFHSFGYDELIAALVEFEAVAAALEATAGTRERSSVDGRGTGQA